MENSLLEADYLVVGSGAMGMSFTDVILTETDASVVMVDRHHRPGGHWNDVYPFVRLHQPSAFYGVNSRQLGDNKIVETGFNEGLYETATGSEICGYFDQVMQKQFLPNGRVKYFPMHDCSDDGQCTSLVTGDSFKVGVRRKIVDATYSNTSVPSTHPPRYEVADGVTCVPPNKLPQIETPPAGYVVIGAGKTAMDACLWLLDNGVAPEAIRWIMPRDAWFIDRTFAQPGEAFFETRVGGAALQVEAIVEAESIEHLFDLLDEHKQLLRLDKKVRPSAFRCATVTSSELSQLRRIKNIVRLGRVKSINTQKIILEHGAIETSSDVLHIDCTADGLKRRPPLRVFDGNTITLQCVTFCQPTFGAAFIGHVEATIADEVEKNLVCAPIPYPESDVDWLRINLAHLQSIYQRSKREELVFWANNSRLNITASQTDINDLEPANRDLLQRFVDNMEPAMAKLAYFLEQADATTLGQ